MYRSKGKRYQDPSSYDNLYPDDPGMHNTGSPPHGADRHTTTTYKGKTTLLERMSETFTGAMLGVGMFTVSFFIIFLNEGKAVQTANSLNEGLRLVVPITNNKIIFQENNHKLVHLMGKLNTDQALVDALFNVKVQAVKLRREVFMFQWVEHQKQEEVDEGSKVRMDTEYLYTKEWKPHFIDSSNFNNPVHHKNPNEMLLSPMTFVAMHTYIGRYMLKDSLKEKLDEFTPFVPTNPPTNSNIKLVDGKYYQAENPFRPQIGDLRVTFSYCGVSGEDQSPFGPPDTVSIIAKQSGNQLTRYQTDAGISLELIHFGEKTAEEMLSDELHASSFLTWSLRFGGWLIMFLGLSFMTNIISTLVSWFPIVRTLVNIGLTAFNLCISVSLSILTIALGWLWYRPFVSLVLVGAGLIPLAVSYVRGSQVKRESKV